MRDDSQLPLLCAVSLLPFVALLKSRAVCNPLQKGPWGDAGALCGLHEE